MAFKKAFSDSYPFPLSPFSDLPFTTPFNLPAVITSLFLYDSVFFSSSWKIRPLPLPSSLLVLTSVAILNTYIMLTSTYKEKYAMFVCLELGYFTQHYCFWFFLFT